MPGGREKIGCQMPGGREFFLCKCPGVSRGGMVRVGIERDINNAVIKVGNLFIPLFWIL